MIRAHDFNTRWWGSPVGIVDEPDFFALDEDEVRTLLEPFDWVEYKSQLGPDCPVSRINATGFFQVDTQLPFFINLKKIESTASTDQLEATFAANVPFSVTGDQLARFTHERFSFIPGCDEGRINDRYALWTNDLAERFPDTCLRVTMEDRVQGWFLAQPGEAGRLQLTLAMLSRDAVISGLLLYHKACLEFAGRGHRLGEAGFSVTNTAVHNMYATLGARFLAPVGQWFWVSETSGGK